MPRRAAAKALRVAGPIWDAYATAILSAAIRLAAAHISEPYNLRTRAMKTGTMQRDQLLALIGSIYDASLQSDLWPKVVKETASLMRSSRALLLTPFHRSEDGGIFVPHGIAETHMQQYFSRYIEHDIWAQRAMEKGAYVEGNVVLDSDLLTEQEFLKSIFYREFLSKMAIQRLCAGMVFGRHSVVPIPTNLAMYRSGQEPKYDGNDRSVLGLLLPHVSRAMGIHIRLRDAELRSALSRAALDRLTTGVVLIGRDGNVLHLNRVAEEIVSARDGLIVEKRQGGMALLTSNASETHTLKAAIALALRPETLEVPHFSHGAGVSRPSGRPGYILNLAPLPPNNEFGTAHDRAHIILFIVDPSAPVVLDAALLKNLYRMSPAEIRVARRVCAGDTTKQAAEAIGVSETTVRTQLNSIFAKTGTSRQSELVKLLTSIGSIS